MDKYMHGGHTWYDIKIHIVWVTKYRYPVLRKDIGYRLRDFGGVGGAAAAYGVVDDEALLRRGIRPGVPRLYKTSNKKYKTAPHIAFLVESETCSYRGSLLNPLDKPWPKWHFKTEKVTFDSHEIYLRTQSQEIRQKAENTYHLFRFAIDCKSWMRDRRIICRNEARNLAIKYLKSLNEHMDDRAEYIACIVDLAKGYVFFSTWMAVFYNEKDVKEALVYAFPGTDIVSY